MDAFANHGYVAPNGYTNFQESLDAITKGVCDDLAFFLATIVAVQVRDCNHFSIGDPPWKSLPIVGG